MLECRRFKGVKMRLNIGQKYIFVLKKLLFNKFFNEFKLK